MQLATVIIEALDTQAMASFWAHALQWEPAQPNSPDDGISIRPKSADGIGLLFVPSTAPKTSKNRLHLDLAGDADQVPRLLALGAARVDIGQGEVAWEVLADPEGNEFCVLPEAISDDRLAAICLDAADPQVQGSFWATVTGWSIVDSGDWGVRLRSTAGTGPALVMGPPVAPKVGTARLQFALTASSDGDSAAELTHLLEIGASRMDSEVPKSRWHMLIDPEHNEFRVSA
jgi:predicted enzyme related to lactoylglutathione lyase